MNVRLISCAIAVVCLLAMARSPARGAEPAPDGSKLTAAQWAEKMAEHITTVQTNHVPDAVVLAYRAGCKIDSKNVQLHQTYMLRMLEFGLLHMAYAPAEAMVKLQAKNVTAFATAGHMKATKGNYAEALAMYVRAAQIEKDDVSIRFNLGELLAWYELEGAGKIVSDEIQRVIDEIKPRKYSIKDPLGRGYARGRSVYKARDTVGRKYRWEIDSLTRSISTLERRIAERANASDSTLVAVKRKRLEEELARARKLADKTSSASLKKMYRKQIASVTASLRKLDSPGGARAAAADRKSLAEKKSRLEEVRAECKKAVGAAGATTWRWDPPTLKGKVIDVVPLVAGSTVIPAAGEEASAAARLKIARLMATHNQPARAVPRLKEIIRLYPATEAAAEARKILADLPE